MAERISVRKAVLVGTLWVSGTVLFGLTMPMVVLGLLAEFGVLKALSREAALVVLLTSLALMLPSGWLGWSLQAPRWRLWSYRRVYDVEELKRAAIEAQLIWPDGHVFERTELRSRDLSIELASLEKASRLRVANAPESATKILPTRLGTAGMALIIGLIMTPVCVLAPAGLLLLMGLDVTATPLFLSLIVLFPVGLAALIFVRARRDGVTADEAFRRIMPRAIRSKDGP